MKKSSLKHCLFLDSGRTTSTAPVEMENAPSLSETARKVDDSLFPTMNEAIRMSRGIRVTAGTPGDIQLPSFLITSTSIFGVDMQVPLTFTEGPWLD